jgi:hypothetical protein
MNLTYADTDGEEVLIVTSGGMPVSGSFSRLQDGQEVLAFLLRCGIEDEDMDHPTFASYPLPINGVPVGFRTELSKKMVWLVAQPAWQMIVDALDLTLDDISIYEQPDIGETLAIKRRPAHAEDTSHS